MDLTFISARLASGDHAEGVQLIKTLTLDDTLLASAL
jgi:hypothetical protein